MEGMKIMIEGKEWTLAPFSSKQEYIETEHGRYFKIDTFLIRKVSWPMCRIDEDYWRNKIEMS